MDAQESQGTHPTPLTVINDNTVPPSPLLSREGRGGNVRGYCYKGGRGEFPAPVILLLILFSFLHANIVITEVSPNPQGGSGEIPGDLSHEFIEFLNCGPDTVNLCQYYIQSGSWGSTTLPDSNNIQVWQGDSLCDIGCGTFLEYDS